jgi:hypothetical protein
VSVVSNSGPPINLAKVGPFSLLKDLFQHVLIPKGVFEEVVVRGAGQPGSYVRPIIHPETYPHAVPKGVPCLGLTLCPQQRRMNQRKGIYSWFAHF